MYSTQDADIQEFNEGVELMRANQIEDAIAKFRAAATKGIDRPMEHYALAVALYKNNDFSEARTEFSRFLEMSPRDNEYVHRAKAILPEIEAKIIEQANSRPKTLADNRPYQSALEAYMRGDHEKAIEDFQAALNDFPNNKHIYNNLGLTHLALSDYPNAVRCFEKAIALDGSFLEARNNLGLTWLDYGSAKARECFEMALQADENFFDAIVNLASLSYRHGEFAKARQLWQRAYSIRPDDPKVRRNLGLG